jgi:hypothetical protein
MVKARPPAGKPHMRVVIAESSNRLDADFDWRISRTTAYALYPSTNFGSSNNGAVPQGPNPADPYGIIDALRQRARLENSGVTEISVRSHHVRITTSPALQRGKARQMFLAALCTAGVPHEVV